jgi:hypothetical protein
MRFHAEHHFSGSVQAVVTLLGDPAFYLGLSLPDLSRPEILEDRKSGDASQIRLRYEFEGSLDPIAHRIIGSSRLAWIQEVEVDLSGSGTLRFEAEKDPKRLHGSATFTVTSVGGVTVRRLDGELIVAVPGIGRMAERRIVPGLLQRLDIEAEALDRQMPVPE